MVRRHREGRHPEARLTPRAAGHAPGAIALPPLPESTADCYVIKRVRDTLSRRAPHPATETKNVRKGGTS
jgi:hypothetical protein